MFMSSDLRVWYQLHQIRLQVAGADSVASLPYSNTYRETPGANEIANCLSCLDKSSTRRKKARVSWRACQCDDIYYRIEHNKASDECLDCPPGLVCTGGSTLQPVLNGSNWTVDGPIFRLHSCPYGFGVYNGEGGSFMAEVQDCQPCDKGEECTTPPCVTCSKCAPGYFKGAIGTEPCTPCPTSVSPASLHSRARARARSCSLACSPDACKTKTALAPLVPMPISGYVCTTGHEYGT